MKRHLPPSSALVAAETAARLGSFKAAADELHVTASAVSHQIRILETWLGFKLFNRKVRSIGLTDAGRRYLFDVSSLFDQLASLTKTEIARSGRRRTITVQTTDSFASRWLVARMSEFFEQTGLGVQIIAFEYTEGFRPAEADIAILYGRGEWRNAKCILLLEERIFPVLCPGLYRSNQHLSWSERLHKLALLHDDNLGTSWEEWLEFVGETQSGELKTTVGQHFNHSHLSLLAAEQGSGIALASWPLVIDALNNGSLIAATDKSMRTGFGYYLVLAGDISTRKNVGAFVDWLLKKAQSDI